MTKISPKSRKHSEKRFLGIRYRTLSDIIYITLILLISIGSIKTIKSEFFTSEAKLISPVSAKSLTTPTTTPWKIAESHVEGQDPWYDFKQDAKKISQIYNFPAKVVISQAAVESNHGRSHFALTRHNYLGIGAFDDNPNDAYSFENTKQMLVYYMELIKSRFPEAWANRDNPEKLLNLIEHNSEGNYYASDPNYVAKVMQTTEWREN